jgi:hypothetical protein
MTERTQNWNRLAAASSQFSKTIGLVVSRIQSWRKSNRSPAEAVWPYVSVERSALVWRICLWTGFAIFCFFYGAFFALLAPFLALQVVSLLVIPAALVIWVLPDVEKPPIHFVETLFFAFFLVMVMWPNYLAIALPGLPWMTLQRLVSLPLSVILLVCLSVSRSVRSHLLAAMAAAPWVRNLFFIFLLLQVISIVFSADKGNSINRFVIAQTTWTSVFLAGCLFFSEEGRAERMARLLAMMSVGLSLIAALEYHMGRTPWAGHIPSFLQINDPTVLGTLEGSARYGSRRVQATYTTPLGYGEYMAIAFPFVLHFAANANRPILRAATILVIPLLVFSVVVSQARVGMVGYFITAVTYPLLWAAFYWRRRSGNLFINAIVYLSPALMAAAAVSLFTVDGIRFRVLGGGATQASDQGRIDQLHMGIPKILSHPWGYGIGMGAETLGYRDLSGLLTIDSYYLRFALEYGLFGLAIFFALFAAGITYAIRGAYLSFKGEKSETLFLPIAVALLNILVIKSAYATEDNAPIIFALFGMLTGLTFRLFVRGSLAEEAQLKPHLRIDCGPAAVRKPAF